MKGITIFQDRKEKRLNLGGSHRVTGRLVCDFDGVGDRWVLCTTILPYFRGIIGFLSSCFDTCAERQNFFIGLLDSAGFEEVEARLKRKTGNLVLERQTENILHLSPDPLEVDFYRSDTVALQRGQKGWRFQREVEKKNRGSERKYKLN